MNTTETHKKHKARHCPIYVCSFLLDENYFENNDVTADDLCDQCRECFEEAGKIPRSHNSTENKTRREL